MTPYTVTEVMTYNIASHANPHFSAARIAAVIRNQDPQVAVLQEVLYSKLDAICRSIGWPRVYRRHRALHMVGGDPFGNAIITNGIPIPDGRTRPLPLWREPRCMTRMRVAHLDLVFTHLSAGADWNGVPQVAALDEFARGADLLMGDLNLQPSEQYLAPLLASGWVDRLGAHGGPITFPKNGTRTDYILVRPRTGLVWKVPKSTASDHYPVVGRASKP